MDAGVDASSEFDASTDATMLTDAFRIDAPVDASVDAALADAGDDAGSPGDGGGPTDGGCPGDTGCPPLGWRVETVDLLGGSGPIVQEEIVAIAIDSSDNVHVAYVDGALQVRYATPGAGAWTSEVVAPSSILAAPMSLAVSSVGTPMISAVSAESNALVFAQLIGSTWETTVVDESGGPSSIVSDDFGHAHIAYVDAENNQLKYAHFSGFEWVVEVVLEVGDTPEAPSLEFDTSGRPSIVFHDPEEYSVEWVRFDGDAWVRQTVQGGSTADLGGHPSHAFDPSGFVFIVFGNVYDQLAYATDLGGSWTVVSSSIIGGDGLDQSIAIASDGLMRFAYQHSFFRGLNFALVEHESSFPTVTTVDSSPAGPIRQDMALDSADQAHIVYIDLATRAVRYATQSSGAP